MKKDFWGQGTKRTVIFSHDLLWVPSSIFAAYWIRFNLSDIPPGTLHGLLQLIAIATPAHALSFWLFGCYRGIWRYASIPDLVRLIKSVTLGAVFSLSTCFVIWRLDGIPRSVMVLYPILLFGLITAVRLTYRIIRDGFSTMSEAGGKRALLVGAGRAGEMLVRDLERHRDFVPVTFVDDDRSKHGHDIRGVRVRGAIKDIPHLIRELNIETVLIAMPSAPRAVLDRIVETCASHGIKCRTLPSLTELANGQVEVSRLRPVTVEDLLGRDTIQLDQRSMTSFLKGKRVLVTGGGGSIGSELCRQIGKHEPALLVVMDNCEYNLYKIDQQLTALFPSLLFNSILGDIRDATIVNLAFEQIKPEVVFHAAAYKHVPMIEDNVIEGIRNNVFGTKILADAAVKNEVGAFVLISTDKTVNPTNIMGTTKRVAEIYCQALNQTGNTHFITTRFGNVLGSAGSVVPLFEQQIAAGGPVTVTHPDITRYFMTIPEAASLILQAGAIGRGGEIFVLDMGEPVKILDLAEKLIQLSGLQPGRDIRIEYVGLRPGEKLHEELFYENEQLLGTTHPKLLLAGSATAELEQVKEGLANLEEEVVRYDEAQARAVLKSLVPEFTPQLDSEKSSIFKESVILKLVKS